MFHFSPEGAIQPGGATGYTISSGGLIYTIDLRPGSVWSDGVPVVAQHYIDGMLRLGSTDKAQLLYPISGFEDWSTGVTTDPAAVGMQALDDHTIIITLDDATAHFVSILATGTINFPVRVDNPTGDPLGDLLGPEVSNGPYIRDEWIGGDHITLAKNPLYWNATSVVIEEIKFTFMSTPDQFEAYQNDELDVGAFPGNESPYVMNDPLLSAELAITPFPGTQYVGLNTTLPHTNDLRIRTALASSLEKQEILDHMINRYAGPASGFIPTNMSGYQENLGYPFDLNAALALLDDYIASTPGLNVRSDVVIEFWSNVEANRLSEFIAEMWRNNLGVEVDYVPRVRLHPSHDSVSEGSANRSSPA